MLSYAKVKSGVLFDYLKDVVIVGKVKEDEEYFVFGCHQDQEDKFYKGILEMEKEVGDSGFGLNSVKEVREFWEGGCDGCFLTVDKDCFEVLTQEDVDKMKPLEVE